MDNFWVGLILGVILGLIAGWLIWRRSPAEDSGLQAELQTAKAEVARLRGELSAAERDTANWRAKYDEQVAANAARPAVMSGPDSGMDVESPAMGMSDDMGVDAPVDVTDTVVSSPVRAFDEAEESLTADMPQEGGLAEAAAEAVAEVPRFGSRFAPPEMPPVEVEPMARMPELTASFLDDLPEGGTVVRCPQDLSAVRGIGQLYEQKLYRRGIGTYWMLSELSDETLADILEVKAFQEVDLAGIRASAREWAEKTDSIGRVWDGTEPDDFEVLEGIGDVYESRLYEAGICTYEALAALTEQELAEICRAPSFRQPDYASWIATAQRLAAQRV